MRTIASRLDLPALLVELGLTKLGVEVGTYEGHFAKELLTDWPGVLHCVDPWAHQPDWRDLLSGDQTTMDRVYSAALERLDPLIQEGRCVVHRAFSLDVAKSWTEPLDFVYLDARHDYPSVWGDLSAWAPLVRPGGILSGHDYIDGTSSNSDFGVKTAVNDWAARNGYAAGDISVATSEPFPSWMIRLRTR